ncbi:HTH-type transcriptional activator RhaR [compost metagenome]
MSIREVSVACGFNSMSYFSRSFLRCFQKKPSDYRQAWPDSEPAPKWPGTIISTMRPRNGKRHDLSPVPPA